MTQYIYEIRNLRNNHFYIGRTNNYKERWGKHRRALKSNKHDNIHLQRAYNIDSDFFEFSLVREINLEDKDEELKLAKQIEQEYLDNHYGEKYFYNISPSAETGVTYGEDHPMYGKHPSDWMGDAYYEAVERRRVDMKGEKNHFYGKHHTEETRKILSEKCALYGERNGFYGKTHTEETKRRIKETKAKNKNLKPPGVPRKVEVDGVIFDKVKDAVKYLGIGETTFYNRMKRGTHNYRYID